MNEIDTLAKALAFEYYVGSVESHYDPDPVNSNDALRFFEKHSEEYSSKAKKILKLISDSYTVHH